MSDMRDYLDRLERKETIKCIHIQNERFSLFSMRTLRRIFRRAKPTGLMLENCNLPAQAFAVTTTCYRTLEYITLEGITCGERVWYDLGRIVSQSKLQALYLDSTNITDEQLQWLGRCAPPSLVSLTLCRCSNITSLRALQSFNQLKHLMLVHCGAVGDIAETLPSCVQYLDLFVSPADYQTIPKLFASGRVHQLYGLSCHLPLHYAPNFPIGLKQLSLTAFYPTKELANAIQKSNIRVLKLAGPMPDSPPEAMHEFLEHLYPRLFDAISIDTGNSKDDVNYQDLISTYFSRNHK